MDWRTRRLIDNIWGPLGTILIHLVVIVILVRYMVVDQRPESREIEVMIREIEPSPELDDIEAELEVMEDIPTVVDAVAPPEVSLEREPPRVDVISPAAADSSALDQMDIMQATSPIQFRGLYRSRSAAGRSDALARYGHGMGGRTEFAVLKALNWLRDHQYPDGSWGPRYRAAMTGLALLSFLAHGETTASEEYGLTVRRGLQYLLRQQRNGMFIGGGPVWGRDMTQGQIRAYEHSIATYAICEAYGLTQIPFLRFAMEDAVQVMLDGQHAGGSWDYDYRIDPGAHIDTSLAGWHIQALKAAEIAGARNRGIRSAIEAGIRGMKAMSDGHAAGLFRYGSRMREEHADVSMTGVAVLSMQLAGYALDADARAGIQALRNVRFRWSRGDVPGQDDRAMGNWPIYAWYYITQARFHQGGATWERWNREFAPGLCDMQNEDGSWPPAPQSREARYGPVYATALNALMLQVYYRLLPTFQAIEVEMEAPVDDVPPEEDVIIRFG